MNVLDLFSGIGGFSLGLERTGGFKTVAFCEIEKYPQKVLAKHWPEVPIYDDVRTLTAERLATDGIGRIDVITGGFPCQDISVAGKQAGIGEGTRSGLWSEIARLIGELRPRYAIMENVTALISGDSGRWFGRVLGDLAALGYDAEWHCIPASELGAHHHRDRVWIIAYPEKLLCNGCNNYRENSTGKISESGNGGCQTDVAYPEGAGEVREVTSPFEGERCREMYPITGNTSSDVGNPQCRAGEALLYARLAKVLRETHQGRTADGLGSSGSAIGAMWATEPSVGRVANGIPSRAHRLKGLGNAVVPQIPELIGRAILEHEKCLNG